MNEPVVYYRLAGGGNVGPPDRTRSDKAGLHEHRHLTELQEPLIKATELQEKIPQGKTDAARTVATILK